MKDNGADARESALDRLATEAAATPAQHLANGMARRWPCWAVSLAVHLSGIWVLCHWPVSVALEESGEGSAAPGGQRTDSVNAGLLWLAKAQEKDGHWDCKFWDGGGYYVDIVGMGGLGAGCGPGAGRARAAGRQRVAAARRLDWLLPRQKPDGASGLQTTREQGILTMAVSDADR